MRLYEVQEEGDGAWTRIEANCADDAAADAVEYWYEGGAWAGDPVPDHVDVIVRVAGEPYVERYRVRIDWSPSFFAEER